MPAILERLVKQLRAKGYSESSSYAIATSSLKKSGNLDSHGNATYKGMIRGSMSPSERAKDRASKRSKGKHRPIDYSYSAKTNRATLVKRRSSKGR